MPSLLKMSEACLSQLESPPTTSPTTLTVSEFYPDYGTAWPDAGCINTRPVPSGRPTYTSRLACCKGAYGAQVSQSPRVQPRILNRVVLTILTPFSLLSSVDHLTHVTPIQGVGRLSEPSRVAPFDVAHFRGRVGYILSRLRRSLGQSRMCQHAPHAVRSPRLFHDDRLLQRRVRWADERVLSQPT